MRSCEAIPQKPRLRRNERYVGGANAWNDDGASPVVPNASGSTPENFVQITPMFRTDPDTTALRPRRYLAIHASGRVYESDNSRKRTKSPSSRKPATDRL